GFFLGAVRDECPLQRSVARVAVGGAFGRGTGPVDRDGASGLVGRPPLAGRAVHDRDGAHHVLVGVSGGGDRTNGPVEPVSCWRSTGRPSQCAPAFIERLRTPSPTRPPRS